MSLYDSNTFLEGLGISPVKTEFVSPVTGQVVKRCAPTSLKDSVAIISKNMQRYYESNPRPVIDDDDDFDYEICPKKDNELTYVAKEDECKEKVEVLLQFLSSMVESTVPKTLYVERNDTTISYGEISARNEKIERGTIGMSSDGILHAVYELIRVRFAEKFNEHISFNLSGWILAPYISEDTEVIISSNRRSDMEWLQREKDTIQEMKRQKKGLQ